MKRKIKETSSYQADVGKEVSIAQSQKTQYNKKNSYRCIVPSQFFVHSVYSTVYVKHEILLNLHKLIHSKIGVLPLDQFALHPIQT